MIRASKRCITFPTVILSGIAAVAIGLVAGCGDDDGGNGTNGVLITAAQGGTVSMETDETSINIPPNALSEDTMISIEYGSLSEYGSLENARERVLEIAPEGLVLGSPASVLIDPGQPAISGGQIVTVVQFIDGGWSAEKPATVVSGGLVSASISVLAPLAVVVTTPTGPTGTISGTVIHFYTEMPLEGITFKLMSGAEELASATSDASGLFQFEEVPVGTYTVHADVTEDQNCYDDPVDKEAVVTEDQTTNVYFGFVPGPCE